MGLFGKRKTAITNPDQLRDELFAAARAADGKRFEQLADANQAAILEHFPSWRKIPEVLRTNPAAAQGYVQGMIAVAQLFAEKLGHPELMASLTGSDESNPITRWQGSLRKARELMNSLRYSEALTLLTDALIDSRGMSGSGVDTYLPITYGYIGEAHFQSGTAEKAIPHFEQALSLCEKSSDIEGIAAYLGSLFEVHRYLGHSGKAADYADRMATHLNSQAATQDANRWRTRARIVRAGEPLNRIVAVVNGVTFELDEVRPAGETRVQLVFERNRVTLQPARVHTERGKALGAAGRHAEALAAFRDAAAADEFDPDSRYLGAFTLLHLGQYAEAAEGYRQVELLAPGWFHCRADLWVAEQLVLGQLDHSDFAALHTLEDGRDPPTEKEKLAEQLLRKRPGLPPAALQLGRVLARMGRTGDAEAALQSGLRYEPDPDVRTRILTELATIAPTKEVRTGLYGEAVALNGNLVAAASAKLALQMA
jgi:tetratricopeptide (TPR) repeat protein